MNTKGSFFTNLWKSILQNRIVLLSLSISFLCLSVFYYQLFFQIPEYVSKRGILYALLLGMGSIALFLAANRESISFASPRKPILIASFVSAILIVLIFGLHNLYFLTPRAQVSIRIPAKEEGGAPVCIASLNSMTESVWHNEFPIEARTENDRECVPLSPDHDSQMSVTMRAWERVEFHFINVSPDAPVYLQVNQKTELFYTPAELSDVDFYPLVPIEGFWKYKFASALLVLPGVTLFIYFIILTMVVKERYQRIFQEFGYEIMLFLLFLSQLYFYAPYKGNLNPFSLTSYLLRYDLVGVQSRAFLGSLLSLFKASPDLNFLYNFLLLNHILNVGLLSFFLGRIIRKSVSDRVSFIVIFLVGVFLANPASYSAYFIDNFDRLDIFLFLLVLITLFVLQKTKLLFIIPILSMIGMAVHQGFAFIYFPLILILIFILAKQMPEETKYKVLLVITIAAGLASFAFFQFYRTQPPAGDLDALVQTLENQADFEISRAMLFSEYYQDFAQRISSYMHSSAVQELLEQSIFMLIFQIPLISLIYYFLFQSFRYSLNNYEKFVVLLVMISPLFRLPLFLFTVDWGRWLISIFISSFILIFFLYQNDFEPVQKALQKNNQLLANTPIVFLGAILFLLYILQLGKYYHSPDLEATQSIFVRLRGTFNLSKLWSLLFDL